MIDGNKFIDYVINKGRQGNRTVEILRENTPFMEALNTTVGKELLKDLVTKHEQLLSKIASLEATDNDRVEYKVVYDMILKWSSHINAYTRAVETISRESDKSNQ